MLDALRSVSAAEFALVRAIYEAEPWGTEWEHTRELCHVTALGGGVTKHGGGQLKPSDFGPQTRRLRDKLGRDEVAAIADSFVGIARKFGAKEVRDGED